MELHVNKKRFSLNGTKEELRSLSGRLLATLEQMDKADAAHASEMAGRAPAGEQGRPLGGHFVDFGLDEIAGQFDVSDVDLTEVANG